MIPRGYSPLCPILGGSARKGMGFHYLQKMKRRGNLSLLSVKGPKRANRHTKKELFSLVIYLYLKDGALTAVKRYAVS